MDLKFLNLVPSVDTEKFNPCCLSKIWFNIEKMAAENYCMGSCL